MRVVPYIVQVVILLSLTGCGFFNTTRDTTKSQTEAQHTDTGWSDVTTKHTQGIQGGITVDVIETTTVEHKGEEQRTAEIKASEHQTSTTEAPPWATALLAALGSKAVGVATGGWGDLASGIGSLLTPNVAATLATTAMAGFGVHAYHKRKKIKLEKRDPPANS